MVPANDYEESKCLLDSYFNRSADFLFLFQLFGFSALLVIIVLAALMSLCDRVIISLCCIDYSRRQVYDSVILEEGEDALKEILRGAAKDELIKIISEKINGSGGGNGDGVGNENEEGNRN